MFTKILNNRAYLLTESLKNRAYLLVLVLEDAFYAKIRGLINFSGGTVPDPLPFFSLGYLCYRAIVSSSTNIQKSFA